MISHNWSPMKRLIWMRGSGIKGGSGTYETVTGNPVSFTAKAAPLRKLSVAFSPVQSLNGYDAPWPAGGGKNKLQNKGTSGSSNGITWTMNADGSVTLGGTASDVVTISFNTSSAKQNIANGSCDLVCSANASYNPNINGLNFQNDIYADGTYVGTIQKDNNHRSVTGDVIEVGTSRLRISADTVIPNNTTFYPAIEIGSTISASWTPYSNICPISGWSSLTVEQRGKNLCGGLIAGTGIGSGGRIAQAAFDMHYGKVKKGETYTVTTDEAQLVCGFFDVEPANGVYSYDRTRVVQNSKTIVAPIDGYLAFRTSENYATAQLELGTTATDYVPYNPLSRSISISLGQTVYSGYVDVVTGVGEITGVCKTYDGSEDEGWAKYGTGSASAFAMSVNEPSLSNQWTALQSNYLKPIASNSTWGYSDNWVSTIGSTKVVTGIKSITALDDWLAYLADNPLQIFSNLATPIPIQLTPQEVQSLAGDNVLFSDANGNLTVEYRSN